MISIFLELGADHVALACTKEAKANQVFLNNRAHPQDFCRALFRILSSYSPASRRLTKAEVAVFLASFLFGTGENEGKGLIMNLQ